MPPDFLPPQHAPRAAGLSSDAVSSPGQQDIFQPGPPASGTRAQRGGLPGRQARIREADGVGRAKPEADREAKGEAILFTEPCADLAALRRELADAQHS